MVIERNRLEKALKSEKKLRIKFGIDPTSPDLHLGHAVVLRKLKEFEDLGCKIVLIIGDFTAQIGDPSGRSETRKPLTEAEVQANMKEYISQAGKILNIKKAEIHYNSEWFKKEAARKIFELAAAGTIQQMLHRADFKKRIDSGGDVSVVELLYPLFQGYDSVRVEADVELGGNDQLFNLITARRVQRHFGLSEQDIVTIALLEGLDGVKKMSKSYNNYVGLNDKPADMFGKLMSLSDVLMRKYFLFCTDLGEEEIKNILTMAPKDAKTRLALEITAIYHNKTAARKAAENFDKLFSKKEISDGDLPELLIGGQEMSGTAMVVASGVVKSKNEARRLIEQGGLTIEKETIKDPARILRLSGEVVKIGKRHFFRVKKADK